MMRQAFTKTSALVRAGAVAGCSQLSVSECASSPAAVLEAIGDADVAIPLMSRIDEAVLDRARNLKLILQFGVGVEGVNIPAASERGIMVSNMPARGTGNALSCAEHALMLMFLLLRDWHACQASVQQRRLGEPAGETLFGKTVLILGFGDIAKELIPRLKVFGVRVLCVRRSLWSDPMSEEDAKIAEELHERGRQEDLPRMLPTVDLVVIAAAQTVHTRGLVNSEFLAHCQRGVRIVNVARGGLLDYAAVLQGLESGHIGGLGLDVHWTEPFDPRDPVATHPKVVLTPHVAGVTQFAYDQMARLVITESLRVKSGMHPSVWLNQETCLLRQHAHRTVQSPL